MDGTNIVPVAAGLAVVGVAFAVAFAILLANSPSILMPDDNSSSQIVNPPAAEGMKAGYIDLERKAQLQSVESDLRQRVSKLGFDEYSVNLNSKTSTIEVVTNDPTKNHQVRALFGNYPSDVPIELRNDDLTVKDFDGNAIALQILSVHDS